MLKMQSLDMNASKTPAAAATSPSTPPDFDFNLPCRYFKSTFARSLSLSNAPPQPSSNHCKSLDYDINTQQQQQQQQQQRSNSSNNCVNKALCPSLPQNQQKQKQRLSRAGTSASPALAATTTNDNGNDSNNINAMIEVKNVDEVAKLELPPALPARRSVSALTSTLNMQQMPQRHKQQSQQQQQQESQQSMTSFRHAAVAAAATPSSAVSSNGNFNKIINQNQQQQPAATAAGSNANLNSRNIVWPREAQQLEQDFNANNEALTTIKTVAKPIKATTTDYAVVPMPATFEMHDNRTNVEAVILQNQVDTLQWQLKQVETSCEMYRAVMEEVARFLERYHSQRQQQRQWEQQNHCNLEQISRSKSLYHVYGGFNNSGSISSSETGASNFSKSRPLSSCEDKPPTASYLRARSSTNLHAGTAANSIQSKLANADDGISYSAFKDFTWRRTPKKHLDCHRPNTPCDDADEKLNQEAFRLSRTIHNLLNTSTQQPDLTQHRNNLAARHLTKSTATSVMAINNACNNMLPQKLATNNNINSAASMNTNNNSNEIHFLRSTNMRDSRLSLRSSTDSSVHSTTSSAASSASSKVETDEELSTSYASATILPNNSNNKQLPTTAHLHSSGSTTEDESGFSSINSFQDVGVPLSSTLLSTAPTSGRQLAHLNAEHMERTHADSRNSTLKAASGTHPNNVVGVPLSSTPELSHLWDVTSAKTYRNSNKFQRFSTLSNDDASTVLWV